LKKALEERDRNKDWLFDELDWILTRLVKLNELLDQHAVKFDLRDQNLQKLITTVVWEPIFTYAWYLIDCLPNFARKPAEFCMRKGFNYVFKKWLLFTVYHRSIKVSSHAQYTSVLNSFARRMKFKSAADLIFALRAG